jgi:signal transduction histidine kinase
MGLSIASGIAELHGGRVSIDSKPGRGSRVALTVPLSG